VIFPSSHHTSLIISDSDRLHTFSLSKVLQTMFSSNASCRFILFFCLSLSANAETIRGAHRELLNSDTSAADPPSPGPVLIGTAGNYAILAKSGISSDSSVITGDIGVSPIAATAMTGFDLILEDKGQYSTTAQVTNGKAYAADYGGPTAVALTTAVSDMETAYTDAAGRSTGFQKLNLGKGHLGGTFFNDTTLVLTTGVYTFGSSVTIEGNIAFKGNSTDIFIIQIAGDLSQDAGTIVTLVDSTGVSGGANSALAENIFWQVAGQATVMANAQMKGILLVKNAVTFQADSSLEGRVLTQKRCDLLDNTRIN
jgi:hypothetical protein